MGVTSVKFWKWVCREHELIVDRFIEEADACTIPMPFCAMQYINNREYHARNDAQEQEIGKGGRAAEKNGKLCLIPYTN